MLQLMGSFRDITCHGADQIPHRFFRFPYLDVHLLRNLRVLLFTATLLGLAKFQQSERFEVSIGFFCIIDKENLLDVSAPPCS